jgi:Tfp pilus assembly major pilin PilA
LGFSLYLTIILSLIAAVASVLAAAKVRFYERRDAKRRDEVLTAIGELRKEIEPLRLEEPAKPRPLSVKMGAEIVELDPEIVARLEALAREVRAGRVGAAFLQQIIHAGFVAAEMEEAAAARRAANENQSKEGEEPRKAKPKA